MSGIDSQWLLEKVVMLPPLLASLVVHEFAHARTALAFGDPTARNMGRCSLNPAVHLDPIGTLAIIFVGFGWARPVPVNPHNLHPPRLGELAVSLAGPTSNVLIAAIIALGLRLAMTFGVDFEGRLGEIIWRVAVYTMAINICLFIFNLLPLYPLDGHHVFRVQLPGHQQAAFMDWQLRYGRPLLMVVLLLPVLSDLVGLPGINPLGWMIDHAMDTMIRHVVLPSGWVLNG